MARMYVVARDEFSTDRNEIIDILVKGTARAMTFWQSLPYGGDPRLTPMQRHLLLAAAEGNPGDFDRTVETRALHNLRQLVRERWRANVTD